MKKLLVLICLSALLLAGCGALDSRMEKDTVFSYVEENRELILFCVENKDFSLLAGKFDAESIQVRDDHVDFDCGGAGFGSETAYRGFFYSEQEDLYAVWCAPSPEQTLNPQENGFFWQEAEGDNTYYVEKICDGFFYYEGTF